MQQFDSESEGIESYPENKSCITSESASTSVIASVIDIIDFKTNKKRYDTENYTKKGIIRKPKTICHKLYAFICYTGGKHYLKNFIKSKSPTEFNTYIEPFLGAGSVFLTLQPKKAILNDLNPYLPLLFYCLKFNFCKFIMELKRISIDSDSDSESFKTNLNTFNENAKIVHIPSDYHFESDQQLDAATVQASLFYYILKRCFNGNVTLTATKQIKCSYWPLRQKLQFFNQSLLNGIHSYLITADITFRHGDYNKILPMCLPGDYLFVDPPYLSNPFKTTHSSYVESAVFTDQNQQELIYSLIELNKTGVKFAMTNSFMPDILDIFEREENIECLHLQNVRGFATCKGLKFRSDVMVIGK